MGLVCLMSACKTSVKSKEWKLVWVEDFDQKNSFDESVWTKIPRGTSDWNNYMSYYDSCYAMQDGNLILRGIANHTQKNDTAPYLTGGVYTKGKKLFTGGRVEVCARLQAAKGAWPAIWMLPEKAEWPKGGEIDKKQIVLGLEPTGHYWFAIAAWMVSNGISVVQVNPYAVKQESGY